MAMVMRQDKNKEEETKRDQNQETEINTDKNRIGIEVIIIINILKVTVKQTSIKVEMIEKTEKTERKK